LCQWRLAISEYKDFLPELKSKMLRNFLGILAQKVTDIRKEKAEVAAEAAKQIAPYRLNILCAGVSMKLVKEAAKNEMSGTQRSGKRIYQDIFGYR
jgi:hypothetical protein